MTSNCRSIIKRYLLWIAAIFLLCNKKKLDLKKIQNKVLFR